LNSAVFEHLPHNQAAENNKAPILQKWLALGLESRHVLEVGSGTGQQGIHLCQACPQLLWQPTETLEKFPLLTEWWQASQQAHITNFLAPLGFVIGQTPFPDVEFDLVYSSNVLHIVAKPVAQQLVEQAASAMSAKDLFVCYGPFKKDGDFTTESNQEFDLWLRSEGYGGLLDIDDISKFSNQALVLKAAETMPANNFLLVFEKQ